MVDKSPESVRLQAAFPKLSGAFSALNRLLGQRAQNCTPPPTRLAIAPHAFFRESR